MKCQISLEILNNVSAKQNSQLRLVHGPKGELPNPRVLKPGYDGCWGMLFGSAIIRPLGDD